jgi:hypothetical protein
MPTEAFYLTYGVHNVCVCVSEPYKQKSQKITTSVSLYFF